MVINILFKNTCQIAEDIFGQWKSRFMILRTGIDVKMETVQKVIVACAVLHNIAIELKEQV